jgi:tetratricopeptide (TPR) repeat protein
MKTVKFNFILLIFFLLVFSSCNKTIVPAGKKSDAKENYDVAAFNYIYVESIKQKLLGNGGDALKYLEQAVKVNPRSDAAYYQMAQIVIMNGDIKNGKKYVNKALSIDNENIWYLTMLAGLYYQEKNIDSAIIYY